MKAMLGWGARLVLVAAAVLVGSAGVSPGAVQLTGPLVKLNGCARGVARLADVYAGTSGPGVSSGQIVTASTTVCTG